MYIFCKYMYSVRLVRIILSPTHSGTQSHVLNGADSIHLGLLSYIIKGLNYSYLGASSTRGQRPLPYVVYLRILNVPNTYLEGCGYAIAKQKALFSHTVWMILRSSMYGCTSSQSNE